MANQQKSIRTVLTHQGDQNYANTCSYSAVNTVPPPEDPIPPSLANHPSISFIKEQMLATCTVCGAVDSYARKIVGCAIFSWCVCLTISTCFLGAWIPFCLGRCYDIEIVCLECGYVKSSLEAKCL